jgi:hypothetical protein
MSLKDWWQSIKDNTIGHTPPAAEQDVTRISMPTDYDALKAWLQARRLVTTTDRLKHEGREIGEAVLDRATRALETGRHDIQAKAWVIDQAWER